MGLLAEGPILFPASLRPWNRILSGQQLSFFYEEIPMRFPALAALALWTGRHGRRANLRPCPWSYLGKTGPLVWGKLDPAYQACSQGHEQSPIDIRGAHLNKALQPIEFHYIAGPVTLENNGHTIVAHVNPGSYIVADGVRYELSSSTSTTPARRRSRAS
jgi:carbonic anhydrase